MKKRLCKALALLLSIILILPVFASNNINVILDGEELEFDVPPQIIDNRVMVPIRAIFEALGATVEWDATTRTAKASIDDYDVICQIGNKTMLVCGEEVEMDTPPIIINGRTLMPARFAAEAFECKVFWQADTRTALLYSVNYQSVDGFTDED